MTVELQYIGHSAFYIKYNGYGILIDPFISQNPLANIDINSLKVDDILVTHGHGDHLGDAVAIAKAKGARITAIVELASWCAKQGVRTLGVNIGGKLEFPWGEVWFYNATHSSSVPGADDYVGVPTSIVMYIDGKTIYHAGDTGLHQDMKTIGEMYFPDVALLPVGGFYTMGPKEASFAAKWLNAKKVIPMHYNTFDVIKQNEEDIKRYFDKNSSSECVFLKPSEILTV